MLDDDARELSRAGVSTGGGVLEDWEEVRAGLIGDAAFFLFCFVFAYF